MGEIGIISGDGRKLGTYVHGLFENDIFRDFIADLILKNRSESRTKSKKDFKDLTFQANLNVKSAYANFKNKNYDLIADAISKNIRIDLIEKFIL